MKILTKWITAVSILALALVSCNRQEPQSEKNNSFASLSIAMQANNGTRADAGKWDGGDEVASLDVYVVTDNGVTAHAFKSEDLKIEGNVVSTKAFQVDTKELGTADIYAVINKTTAL